MLGLRQWGDNGSLKLRGCADAARRTVWMWGRLTMPVGLSAARKALWRLLRVTGPRWCARVCARP